MLTGGSRPMVLPVRLGLLLVLLPGICEATDTEEMWLLGFGVHWSNLGAEDRTHESEEADVFINDSGIGGTVFAGYGFTGNLAFRLEAAASQHDTDHSDVQFFYSSILLGGMYIFRDMETFRPYLFGGGGWFSAESREDRLKFDTTGPGISLAGGFYYFFTDEFALDIGLRGDFISWNQQTAQFTDRNQTTFQVQAPIEESGSAAKLTAGANWWF